MWGSVGTPISRRAEGEFGIAHAYSIFASEHLGNSPLGYGRGVLGQDTQRTSLTVWAGVTRLRGACDCRLRAFRYSRAARAQSRCSDFPERSQLREIFSSTVRHPALGILKRNCCGIRRHNGGTTATSLPLQHAIPLPLEIPPIHLRHKSATDGSGAPHRSWAIDRAGRRRVM